MRILVCHPGRQHSHQMAMALDDAGMLAGYITGIPTHTAAGGWAGRKILAKTATAYAIPLDPARVEHNFVATVTQRVAHKALPERLAASCVYRSYEAFDWWVSRRLASYMLDVVVAYENSARRTFRQARKLGIRTVLDAASFHHAWQDRFHLPAESARVHRRINAGKDAEIRLADRILTVSNYARQSYLDAGVDESNVTAIPMGVDLARFAAVRRAAVSDPMRFVFVGHLDERKGADVLRDAATRLVHAERRLELSTIGNPSLTFSWPASAERRHLGWMPASQLAQELPRHDVLVLPSRHDSFGMVVAEAMACGLPVIVSDHVGAKEMVTPGENGLIVPAGDVNALATAMAWFLDHRNQWPAMSRAACASAQRYDWAVYRRRAVEFFQSLEGVA